MPAPWVGLRKGARHSSEVYLTWGKGLRGERWPVGFLGLELAPPRAPSGRQHLPSSQSRAARASLLRRQRHLRKVLREMNFHQTCSQLLFSDRWKGGEREGGQLRYGTSVGQAQKHARERREDQQNGEGERTVDWCMVGCRAGKRHAGTTMPKDGWRQEA